MHVILYTTHCPHCTAMVNLLKSHNVDFTECSDISIMKAKHMTYVPWIEFEDGTLLDLKGAYAYFNKTK